ncbi:MAG TPA: dienelactone hydrolase family protein [Roseiarcus sp.]|jgi:carboxymethylenebutenolidase
MGAEITFKRPDGGDAKGYLANAASGDAPGVVVIQEWWGLAQQIKAMVDRFALAGFDALAPDLYNGVVVPYHDADHAAKEMQSLNFLDATEQNVRGAVQYLKRNGAKVGIAGYCMGGAVAVIASAKIPELTAAVSFYGLPPEQAVMAADVKIPLQGHFANKDDYITPKTVDDFEKALKAAGKDAEFFRYDADHAFVNEQRMAVHDRQAAELAWGRAVAFLKKRLG